MRKEPPISSNRGRKQNDIQSANSYEKSLENNSSSLHEPIKKKNNRLWMFITFGTKLLLLVFVGYMFEPIIRAKMGASYDNKIIPSLSIAERQTIAANSLKSSLPVKNNELTTWIGIEAEGDTLIYTIKFEVDSKVLTKQQKELAYNAEQEALCFPTQIDQEKLLREGYKYKHIFLDKNDIVFQTIFTNKNSCGFD
jgi:hypothetical protein